MDSKETYRRFAKFYDAYVEGFTRDIPMYLNLLKDGDAVLEIGCGTGRVLRPILQSGYRTVGVDISEEMLKAAERKLASHLEDGSLKLLRHNFAELPLANKFDKVFVTFYTFNYLIQDQEQRQFLKHAAESMKPGALLVMDLFYPASLQQPELAGQWGEKKHFFIEGKRVELQDKRSLSGNVEERIQVFSAEEEQEEIVTLRRFVSKKEIYELLQQAGFHDIRFTENYDGAGFHSFTTAETTQSGFTVIAGRI